MTVASVAAGALFGVGMALVFRAWTSSHLSLAERVRQGRSVESDVYRQSLWGSIRKLWLRLIESVGSTTRSVERRLELLGGQQSVVHFRVQQLIVAIATTVSVGAGAVLFLRSLSVASLVMSLVALGIGALLGVATWDHLLTMRAQRRQRIIDQQVPDTCDLLALAIGAGESIPAALERMSRIAQGELSIELARTVNELRLGISTTDALNELARRNDSSSLERLCQTLVTAVERGSPLAVVLHDQAQDIRETARQKLLEEGGRREILMLIPVVFLILPITVLFALYPGLAALNVTP